MYIKHEKPVCLSTSFLAESVLILLKMFQENTAPNRSSKYWDAVSGYCSRHLLHVRYNKE